eukprot:8507806-Alexandrium_andersonii.AAC.1
MTVNLSRGAAKFSSVRTCVDPFFANVFSPAADVNHNGFWSQFTQGSSSCPLSSAHSSRTARTLCQKARNRRSSFSFPHFMRRLTARQVTP